MHFKFQVCWELSNRILILTTSALDARHIVCDRKSMWKFRDHSTHQFLKKIFLGCCGLLWGNLCELSKLNKLNKLSKLVTLLKLPHTSLLDPPSDEMEGLGGFMDTGEAGLVEASSDGLREEVVEEASRSEQEEVEGACTRGED